MIKQQYWKRLCDYQEIAILEMMELIADFREEAKQAGKKMSVLIMNELYNKCNLILLQNSVLHHYTTSKDFLLTSTSTLETNAEIKQ
ncbi:MAG TPA: hypothetical protein VMU10_04395 [Desulfomonilia bacterium]|nr:hypothetical protein [Desulfomonilia bacterium]